MQSSYQCVVVPLLYASVLLCFEWVLVRDSKERADLYPEYYAEIWTGALWSTVVVSVYMWTRAVSSHPGVLLLDSMDTVVTHCARCDLHRPPRTHHCSQCNHCIPDMDHHCSYLNNCIGRDNKKLFVLFLSANCPTSLLYLYFLCNYTLCQQIPSYLTSFPLKLLFVCIALCQVLAIALVLALTFTHYYLVFRNMTTLELITELKRVPPRWFWEWDAEFDQGVIANFRNVFGRSHMSWCVPSVPALPPVIMTPLP